MPIRIIKEPSVRWESRQSSNNQNTYSTDATRAGCAVQTLIKHVLPEDLSGPVWYLRTHHSTLEACAPAASHLWGSAHLVPWANTVISQGQWEGPRHSTRTKHGLLCAALLVLMLRRDWGSSLNSFFFFFPVPGKKVEKKSRVTTLLKTWWDRKKVPSLMGCSKCGHVH